MMQRALIKAGVIAVSAIVLAACAASGVRVFRTDVANQYDPQTLGLIGSGAHELKVEVQGNPFATSEDVLVDAVVAGLQGRTSGIPVNFSTAPENPFPRGNYRTILVFNAASGVSQFDLCRADDLSTIPTAPANGITDVRLFAAYCQAELPLSWAGASGQEIPGPGSERFDQMIAQVAQVMFPSRNPKLEEDCIPTLFPCP